MRTLVRVAVVVLLLTLASTAAGRSPAWQQSPAPVLTATLPWEGPIVGEPTVLYKNGVYRMWYGAGLSDRNALGYATSRDGVHWRKNPRPVLGLGGSGFFGNVTHANVLQHDGRFYVYFNQDATSLGHEDPALYLATSKDGIRWTVRAQPVLAPGEWDNSLANSYVWIDKRGWHMVYEAMNNQTGRYLIGIASSRDGIHWARVAGPIMELRHGTGMTGGPWMVRGKGGFTLYYHASTGERHMLSPDDNLPTDIYAAHSADLRSWTTSPSPVVTRAHPEWQLFQVADPSIVQVPGTGALMFFAAWGPAGPYGFGGIGKATLG